MKEQIWIDTDMGNDDMMAITMLLAADVNIRGFSTVNGVSSAAKGSENLNTILSFVNKAIPVYEGYARAIKETDAMFPISDRRRAESMTLLSLEVLKFNASDTSVVDNLSIEDVLYDQTPTATTIVALGPLTNIANTILKYGDDFTNNVKQLLIMGGGIAKGNVGPEYQAEYNIYLDPEAAKIVFESGVPITLVGIDATDLVPATKKFQSDIAQTNASTPFGAIIKSIILKNNNDFDAFYDQLTVSILLDRSIVSESIQGNINIVLNGQNRGKTELTEDINGNCNIVMKVDADRLYTLLQKMI